VVVIGADAWRRTTVTWQARGVEQVWVFDQLAVSVARIDFIDPKVAGEPDARERGVRIEVRPVTTQVEGTIYVSATTTLHPAICRIDFLESAPGAADRMHWHPEMHDGEPGDRTFDRDMPLDPIGWLSRFLHGLDDFLRRAEVPDLDALGGDVEAIREDAGQIAAAVEAGLAWARADWPDVEHDERGMAPAR
jgi:hypothetical protein